MCATGLCCWTGLGTTDPNKATRVYRCLTSTSSNTPIDGTSSIFAGTCVDPASSNKLI